jgi:hypothetical protein
MKIEIGPNLKGIIEFILWIIVISIILVALSKDAKAQDLKSQAEDIVLGNRVELISSSKGDAFASEALWQFIQGGEERLDSFTDQAHKSWFSFIDIYIGVHAYDQEIIDVIKADESAGFRSPKVKKASIHYAEKEDKIVIIILSYY